jgi:hypothetical protein
MYLSVLLLILATPCKVFLYCIRMREGDQKTIVVLTCPLRIFSIPCEGFVAEAKR